MKTYTTYRLGEYEVFKAGIKKGEPKTLHDRVVRFLFEGLKFGEVRSKSKYRQFKGRDPGTYYFVGKNGAVRAGKTASDSVSLTGTIHSNMILWERRSR